MEWTSRIRANAASIARQRDAVIAEESRRLGPIVCDAVNEGWSAIGAGSTTAELCDALERAIERRDLAPSMLGYHGFPRAAAVSVNDQILHAIPGPRELKDGDVVKIQVTVCSDKAYAALGRTFLLGTPRPGDLALAEVTRRAVANAATCARIGNRVGDLGHAIQSTVEGAGFRVVREWVGYGMAQSMIGPPQISGTGKPGTGQRLKAGMILNLHAIAKAGDGGVVVDPDRWTARAADGGCGALETCMVLVSDAPAILTPLAP
jgi:methionyl aminopeptidase